MKVNNRISCLLVPPLLVAFAILPLSCSSGQKENVHINTVSGQAHIYKGHTDSARETAINNALHIMVLKSYIDEDKNSYKLIQPFINIRESGIVHNWKVLREKEEDSTLFVQVRGAVNRTLRDEKVDEVMKTSIPDALLLVEKDGQKGNVDPVLGSLFSEEMVLSQMGVIHPKDVFASTDKAETIINDIMDVNVTSKRWSSLISETGAEILVIASVSLSDQSEVLDQYDTSMKSIRAVINIRSVDSYTGKILSSRSDTAAGAHVDMTTASQMAIRNCITKSTVFGKEGDGQFLQQTIVGYLNLLAKREYSIICEGGDLEKLVDGLILSSDRVISAHADGSAGVSLIFSGSMKELKTLFGSSANQPLRDYTLQSATSDTLTLSTK